MPIQRLLLLLFVLTACSPTPQTGPADVAWDRDACERCRMMLSDRHYAAQIRGGPHNQAYKFDDLGCALHWLENQDWKYAPATRIWVTAADSGEWLDARQAHYLSDHNTPMAYGFGAYAQAQPGSMNFTTVREKILSFAHKH